jgi:hypothetical protein
LILNFCQEEDRTDRAQPDARHKERSKQVATEPTEPIEEGFLLRLVDGESELGQLDLLEGQEKLRACLS